MSEENVEIVRRIYREGLIDRDPKRLLDHFATPDIEYVDPPEAVDPGTRRGRTEVLLALRRARQSSASYRHELHELFDLGDTVVAAASRHSGRPSSSEIQEEAHTWTLRDGKVVRFDRGLNLKSALEAAGLRE
ncbi:MAG TPA: nuclear transport factor 2 family protein [Vicinamibacterales bacterium]|jgi:ketosteroid isomerase-like protein|nr:nuclear transport factor 2 family protein [Vicinamibacterales bacterium]